MREREGKEMGERERNGGWERGRREAGEKDENAKDSDKVILWLL